MEGEGRETEEGLEGWQDRLSTSPLTKTKLKNWDRKTAVQKIWVTPQDFRHCKAKFLEQSS